MIKKLLCLLGFFFSVQCLHAQQTTTLTGKILLADGQSASGVTIWVTPAAISTASNADGSYQLKLKPGKYKLHFTHAGTADQDVIFHFEGTDTKELPNVILKPNLTQLKDVVITGQYAPQSLKNSVYKVHTITNDQIRLQNPTKVSETLAQQLGFRFSNDLTLGTANVVMNGMAGQRVKILLDGIPLLDRLETRESLDQIDINSIDHIEMVDGPMSVNYGTDALAGVINLISRKPVANQLQLSARVQEQTAGQHYSGWQGSGNHLANLGLNWGRGNWQIGGNFTRNFFDGALQGWMPKDQYLGNTTAAYYTNKLTLRYRLDAENETLRKDGAPNPNTYVETDAHYITYRWMHQLQADWAASEKWSFNGAAAYTDYSRRTQTTTLNTLTGDRRLTTGPGEQDKSIFNSKFIKGTAQYAVNNNLLLQPGIEINLNSSSGARMLGTPVINDYAFFISGEWKPLGFISLRPGVRFTKNSVYDAPPAIPSFNTKISFSRVSDLRLAYARGFRAPSLSELYFDFHDASHNIDGNQNLKAEYSDSFNGSFSYQPLTNNTWKWRSSLSGYFNNFTHLITTGYTSVSAQVMTYINIDKAKTAGASFENTINYKNLETQIGFSYTGMYTQLDNVTLGHVHYTWYPEASATLLYHIRYFKSDIALFYKFNGTQPAYEVDPNGNIYLSKRSGYNLADFTLNKQLPNRLTLSGGIKNIFNVTRVNNTSLDTGGAHSTGGPVPLGYGRSYFLGLSFLFSKS